MNVCVFLHRSYVYTNLKCLIYLLKSINYIWKKTIWFYSDKSSPAISFKSPNVSFKSPAVHSKSPAITSNSLNVSFKSPDGQSKSSTKSSAKSPNTPINVIF